MKGLLVPLLVSAVLLGTTAISVQADLTPIYVPYTTQVLQTAINNAQVGVNKVVVTDSGTYAAIAMKSGVPVEAVTGQTPIIDAGTATHAVLFPPDADANTILQGFEVVGGDTAVVLQGAAYIALWKRPGALTLTDCTLEGESMAAAARGTLINSDNACSVFLHGLHAESTVPGIRNGRTAWFLLTLRGEFVQDASTD